MKLIGKLYLLSLLILLQNALFAQSTDILGRRLNTISTAAPFLLISPDPIGAGMGENGVATANDVYSLFWNPAKYAVTNQLQSNDPSRDFRAAFSYAPWLRNLVSDIWLGSFYGSKLLSENSAISASFRYFSLGDISFTTIQGDVIGTSKPVEWTADVAYSQRLSDHWYGGVALRYIHSNLTNGQLINGMETKPGTSVAADLSAYYETHLGDNNNVLSFGACISNIGSKMSYTKDKEIKEFIPTLLRVGPSFYWNINNNHQFRFSFQLDKLLVPTPPYYAFDSLTNEVLFDNNNDPVILKGRSSDVSVLRGMVQSFYDAPEGLKEEIHEIGTDIGLEYRFYNILFVRGGYFTEHESKGGRKYLTYGIGIKYKFIEAHVARIYDTEQGTEFKSIFSDKGMYRHGILDKTMRFSIAFDLAGIYKS